uniref:Synaptosomal-associated protein n=1 Tax=Electrophorus electricus TaxID=8005 RepID=A0A4W4HDA7_ELEEL
MADMSVEDMTMRANQLTDEVWFSSLTMFRCVENYTFLGMLAFFIVIFCSEQLREVERGMDQINEDMKQADKNLTDLSKCCGLCVCPCDRVRSIEHDGRYKRTWGTGSDNASTEGGEGHVVSSQPASKRNGQAGAPVSSSGPYIKRITNDDREVEMEENLDQVGSVIGNLKNMALDMGNEIDKQNKTIDRINEKADMNKVRIDEANQRANKLL